MKPHNGCEQCDRENRGVLALRIVLRLPGVPTLSLRDRLVRLDAQTLERIPGGAVLTKPIEDAWNKFEVMVMPKDAGPVQRDETRKAFYAGASVLFRILVDRISSDEEPTDQDMRLMDDLAKEVDEFGQELDAAVLKGKGFKA